jgi:hypothetical protein
MSGSNNDALRLKRRADYFLTSPNFGRGEVTRFAEEADKRGRVFIIGGMLRDLVLGGNRLFSSDVDFVIDNCSWNEFTKWMHSLDGEPNRFGGFAVKLGKWKADMWLLEHTWAKQEGYCDIREPVDLLNATFFDWDAIMYDIRLRKPIIEQDYFERISSRIIDIRLLANPNPLGNAIRALRYAYRWSAGFGLALSEHVLRQIIDHEWDQLVKAEYKSFSTRTPVAIACV